MRSLPMHNLVSLIANSVLITPYTDFKEFIKIYYNSKDSGILVSPLNEDKVLLIQSISKCLSLININTEDLVPCIVNHYNNCSLKYLEANSSIADPSLTFLTNDRVAMIMNRVQQGYNKELDIIKVQMFIYASPWLDMDEYLKYLYYLYE